MDWPFHLATLWAFIIAFAVFMYVVMDGFDLGLGMLFPLFPEKEDRDVMMNSVAPVWDGNETWLVLGGGGLMAAFPLAYAVLMPAIYTPIIAMLIGLIFRGVAFEFRWRSERELTTRGVKGDSERGISREKITCMRAGHGRLFAGKSTCQKWAFLNLICSKTGTVHDTVPSSFDLSGQK